MVPKFRARRIGRPTATGIGVTSDLGAGLGLTIRPGDLLRSTMAAGSMVAGGGVGARVRIYGGAVYGPAFVGFLGGFHVGFGFGFGAGVGWFPLGWGEPYHPWYHCGNGYWNRINVHNTYIHNVNEYNRTT